MKLEKLTSNQVKTSATLKSSISTYKYCKEPNTTRTKLDGIFED